MKSWPSLLGVASAFALGGHALAWQPSPGHEQVPIWPGSVPDARPVPGPETDQIVTKSPVAGKPWLAVRNVSTPTMTVYSPRGRNTGAAVVVFPGGGYQVLAMDLEGTEVCDWLISRGITAVLLKYRVPSNWGRHRSSPPALQDAQRTLGLVRAHAAERGIDPHKIGVLGFSAGGHLVAALSTQFQQRTYRTVDGADKVSCRPDFAVALYPGHLAVGTDELRWSERKRPASTTIHDFRLNPDIRVTRQTPPTFLLQAQDDPIDRIEHSLLYYAALRKAGVPTELHVFPQGGHAFGLRQTALPVTRWPRLVETWLGSLGMISF